MSAIQQNTSTTTTYNDGSQVKTNEFTKKTNLLNENDSGKPEFEYSKPAPTTLQTQGMATGAGTTTNTSMHYEQKPSKSQQIKDSLNDIGHSIGEAVGHVSNSINNAVAAHTNKSQPAATAYNTSTSGTSTGYQQPIAATTTTTTATMPQTTNTNTSKGGFSGKLSDMMAHVGAALHHGHPVHAVTNASTAAKIGECERAKHEHGPLPETGAMNSASSLDNPNFNAAGQPYENKSTAGSHQPTTATTFNQSTAYSSQPSTGSTDYTTKERLKDMASHASAQLSHGNPVTALADAPAAARIAEAEKMKHQKGPLGNSVPENDSAGLVSSNQSMQSGSLGGVTGISGHGGASSYTTQQRY